MAFIGLDSALIAPPARSFGRARPGQQGLRRAALPQTDAAPPPRGAGRRALFGMDVVACPLCGSEDTERLAEFGSTSCKSLWRCKACREPFDHFKCH